MGNIGTREEETKLRLDNLERSLSARFHLRVGGTQIDGQTENKKKKKKTPINFNIAKLLEANKKDIKILSPLENQVDGTHYKTLKIQPVQYCHANNVPFMEGSVIKYVTRHKTKNGADDIKKAIHFCEMILQLEYPDHKNTIKQ